MTINPKIILFDWDGTLVDSYGFIEAAHDFALLKLGKTAREKGWFKDYFGKPRDFIYRDIYPSHEDIARGHFEQFVQEHHKDLIEVMSGAEDLLRALETAKIPMGVVSNKRSTFIHAEVKHLGWDHFFRCVIGSGDALEDKPSAEPVYEALKQGGYEENIADVLYVGDTVADMQTSKNAGCPWIFINPNETQPEWITDYPPIKIAKSCDVLKNYLLQ